MGADAGTAAAGVNFMVPWPSKTCVGRASFHFFAFYGAETFSPKESIAHKVNSLWLDSDVKMLCGRGEARTIAWDR